MEDEENDVYIGSHKDLYATSFVDEEFLSTGLTKENALEYFRRSPFYSEGDLVELEGSDSSESCEFFKIVKYRKDEQEKDGVALLAVYYVLRGTIYQCPDLYSLLKYRMVGDAGEKCFLVQLRVPAESELHGAEEVRLVLSR